MRNMPSEPIPSPPLNRREAIRSVIAMLGGVALAGGSGLLAALDRTAAAVEAASGHVLPGDFTAAQIALLDEIAETILPATKTPGAKAAKTGAFMALMVTDSYGPEERKTFREGMGKVERGDANGKHGVVHAGNSASAPRGARHS